MRVTVTQSVCPIGTDRTNGFNMFQLCSKTITSQAKMQQQGQTLADLLPEVQQKAGLRELNVEAAEHLPCDSFWQVGRKAALRTSAWETQKLPENPPQLTTSTSASWLKPEVAEMDRTLAEVFVESMDFRFSSFDGFFHGFSIGCPWVFHWMITLHRWKESCKSSQLKKRKKLRTPGICVVATWRRWDCKSSDDDLEEYHPIYLLILMYNVIPVDRIPCFLCLLC